MLKGRTNGKTLCGTILRRRNVFLVLCLTSLSLSFSSCSPWYVMRAGWEEAGILIHRKDIDRVVRDPKTEPEVARKLELVLAARAFAQELGLTPKGSFLQYSQVDRDVLSWVITASPKTSLSYHTWWFPIVGSVPYKGFFTREEAVAAAQKLEAKGNDSFVRPSIAYSTLGWFDDPVLSSHTKLDDISLVNTVIHEIVHNTIWIPDQVEFNETFANTFAGLATIAFYTKREGPDGSHTRESAARLHDEEIAAEFFAQLYAKLAALYANPEKRSTDEILRERENIFRDASEHYQKLRDDFQSQDWRQGPRHELQLNNARVLAQRVYLREMEVFLAAHAGCGYSLAHMMQAIVTQRDAIVKATDAFSYFREHETSLCDAST